MINLLKASPAAALLSWLVASVVGRQGSSGGALQIHQVTAFGTEAYFSWPLFIVATGLAWGILKLME